MAKRRISKKSVRKIKRRRKRSTRRQRGGEEKRKLTEEQRTFLQGILNNGDKVYLEAYNERTSGLGFKRCGRSWIDPTRGTTDEERWCQMYKIAYYALKNDFDKADEHAKRITMPNSKSKSRLAYTDGLKQFLNAKTTGIEPDLANAFYKYLRVNNADFKDKEGKPDEHLFYYFMKIESPNWIDPDTERPLPLPPPPSSSSPSSSPSSSSPLVVVPSFPSYSIPNP